MNIVLDGILGLPVSQRVVWQKQATQEDLPRELISFDTRRLEAEELCLPPVSNWELIGPKSEEIWDHFKQDADTLVRLFNIARAKQNFVLSTVNEPEELLFLSPTNRHILQLAGNAGGYNFYLDDQYGYPLMPGCNYFLACNQQDAFLVRFDRNSEELFKLIRMDSNTDHIIAANFVSTPEASEDVPLGLVRGLVFYDSYPESFSKTKPKASWHATDQD